MIKKSALLCGALSLISMANHAMEIMNPADCLKKADAIAIWDPEEEKQLMQKKYATYEALAANNCSQEGVLAQLHMAIKLHNSLFDNPERTGDHAQKKINDLQNKYKAMPYWTALANQADIPALRVLGLEMLGVYHQEGWHIMGAEKKSDLRQAKAYFERARAAYKDNDPECQKDMQTVPRLEAQIQAIINAMNNR